MNIPRNKPDGMWSTEWVAMHMAFHFPEVTDAGFLAAFKKVMIEVVGQRLYEYRAAEQVEERLVSGGHSCPSMEKEAAAEGLSRYSKIKDFIRLQMDVLQGAAAKWQGHDPIHLEMWPAWMLQWAAAGVECDWRERWAKAGGKVFKPLIEGRNPDHGETGLIALKTDPVWQRLGDPAIFSDALGIDHPPFHEGSWLTWSPVTKIEAVSLGLMPSDQSPEVTAKLLKLHVEHKQAMADRIDRSIRESNEEYAKRNSLEGLTAREKERLKWYEVLDLSDVAVSSVKKAVAAANHEELSWLGMRMREALSHEDLKHKPKAKAALHRAMGLVEESRGRTASAIKEYQFALGIDPGAGCQRDLQRLARCIEGVSPD